MEIVVVCNRSEESSQRVATEFGIPRIAATWCAPSPSFVTSQRQGPALLLSLSLQTPPWLPQDGRRGGL